MKIRDALPSDAEVIREVHSQSIKALGTEAYSQEQVNAWARGCESANYTAAIESNELEYIVAESDDGIVAFGSLKLTPPEGYEADVDAEVTAVYVLPSKAQQGIGTSVYTELEERARRHGVKTLGLSSSLNAVAFYKSVGYRQVREYDHEFSSQESTGVTGTVIEMIKRL